MASSGWSKWTTPVLIFQLMCHMKRGYTLPSPNPILGLLLTVLKKQGSKTKREKKSSFSHACPPLCEHSQWTINLFRKRKKRVAAEEKKKKIRRIKLGFNCCCPLPPRPSNTNSNRAAQLTALEVISTFFPRQLQNSVLKWERKKANVFFCFPVDVTNLPSWWPE